MRNRIAITNRITNHTLIKFNHIFFLKKHLNGPFSFKTFKPYFFPRFLKKDAYMSTVVWAHRIWRNFLYFFLTFLSSINYVHLNYRLVEKLITTRKNQHQPPKFWGFFSNWKSLKIIGLLWLERGTGLKKLGLQSLKSWNHTRIMEEDFKTPSNLSSTWKHEQGTRNLLIYCVPRMTKVITTFSCKNL